MFYIYIDDIRIGGPELPEGVAIAGPTEAATGVTVTYTASALGNDVTFAWTAENGTPATATGDTYNVSWTTPGNHNVILAATNTVGTVYDTLNVEVFNCGTVTTLPYTTHFDSLQSLRCWNTFDANNDGFTWDIMSGYGAVNFSYDEDNEEAIEPNDYLVSPAISLPANGNYELNFKLQAAGTNDWAAEHYSVYVSNEGHSPADFVNAVFSETLPNNSLTEHTVNLSNYAGQTIYIAFRHHDCEDMYALILKEVEIRSMQAPEIAISAPATAESLPSPLLATTSTATAGQSKVLLPLLPQLRVLTWYGTTPAPTLSA